MRVKVDLVAEVPGLGERLGCIEGKLDELIGKMSNILENMNELQERTCRMAHSIDEVLDLVKEDDTVIDGVLTLLTEIKKKLEDVLASGGGTSADTQAKIDAIFDNVTADKAKVEAAILENTPSA